ICCNNEVLEFESLSTPEILNSTVSPMVTNVLYEYGPVCEILGKAFVSICIEGALFEDTPELKATEKSLVILEIKTPYLHCSTATAYVYSPETATTASYVISPEFPSIKTGPLAAFVCKLGNGLFKLYPLMKPTPPFILSFGKANE